MHATSHAIRCVARRKTSSLSDGTVITSGGDNQEMSQASQRRSCLSGIKNIPRRAPDRPVSYGPDMLLLILERARERIASVLICNDLNLRRVQRWSRAKVRLDAIPLAYALFRASQWLQNLAVFPVHYAMQLLHLILEACAVACLPDGNSQGEGCWTTHAALKWKDAVSQIMIIHG